jgi:two-component system response regulator YesN
LYKLMIVDDEALVRDAIKTRMDWEAYGFECVCDCEDGEEALERMEVYRPDAVLTDIYMPFMDGLALTREVSKRYPGTKVIILTGYDDFEYAQQAVKLKAFDFVLKPITATQLSEVLQKLKAELDEERKKLKDLDALRRQLHESLPLLKERFLERMVTSEMTEAERNERFREFGIRWEGSCFVELAIDADDFPMANEPLQSNKSKELLRFAVFNIAQELSSKGIGTCVFRSREEKVFVIVSGPEAEQLETSAYRLAEEIRTAVSTYLPVTVSIGCSHSVTHLDRIPEAHRAATTALEYRFIVGKNEIIRSNEVEQRQQQMTSPAPYAFEKELAARVKTGTEQEINEWIERMFTEFRAGFIPVESCYSHIQRWLLHLENEASEGGVNLSEQIHEVPTFPTLDALELWVKEVCRQTVQQLRSAQADIQTQQVASAKAYIRQHLDDVELSLRSVCKHVSMSTSHYSSIFKAHTGKTFIEYVTNERMAKAKELLKLTDLKSYEIAHKVGFNDPHYFSVTFKKATGDSPTEYRNKLTGDRKA